MVAMTEWNAAAYNRVSALQKWLAEKSLAGLQLHGDERVLDLGCGDGKVTAEIADRVPRGSVLGVDASHEMIAFAERNFPPDRHPRLSFAVAEATRLAFDGEFDVIVSFNCLHWVREQAAALRGIARALTAAGYAHLRFVAQGTRQGLEEVIEETRRSPPWAAYFPAFATPFFHPTAEQYRALVAANGLRVERLDIQEGAWDFHSRDAFVEFADATFVEWTRMLPADRHRAFINDALDRYARLADSPAQANVFTFYQLEAVLRRI